MNTYPSSTPSPPRPPPLVVPHALAARGPDPPGPVDLASSREEVPSRTGLATISLVAAPPPRAATRISLWDRVGAFLGYAGRSEEERARRQLLVRAFALTAAQVCALLVVTPNSSLLLHPSLVHRVRRVNVRRRQTQGEGRPVQRPDRSGDMSHDWNYELDMVHTYRAHMLPALLVSREVCFP